MSKALKYLLCVCSALVFTSCATKQVIVPKAHAITPSLKVPVQSGIDKVKKAQVKNDEVIVLAHKAQEKGITANSTESKQLVEAVTEIKTQLDSAQTDLSTVQERAKSLEVERDGLVKDVNTNATAAETFKDKANTADVKIAVVTKAKWKWIIISVSLILSIIVYFVVKYWACITAIGVKLGI